MEKIINLDGLYSNLKNLIDNKSDINDIMVILEKIHFEIIKRDLFGQKSQEQEKYNDIEIISKIGFYLLSVLLDLKPQGTEREDFTYYGMSVAGFCFELLSKLAVINPEEQWEYNLLSSVCYSLSENQANAIVLAIQGFLKLNKHKDGDFIYLLLLKFLSREYKYILKYQIPKSNLSSKPIIDVLKDFSRFMIFGGNAEIILTKFSNLKHQLYSNNSQYFFTFALIYNVALEMCKCSIRNLLQSEPELETYLKVVTQIDTKNVYELWASQTFLIKVENQEESFLSDNPKNDISIISMPTSAGKTMIAELAIFKSLIKEGGIAVYVVPSLALTNEMENNFFRRFRKVGIDIKKEIDIDKIEELNFSLPQVYVLTPEKLDLVIRKNFEILSWIRLIIFDEFHKTGDGERGWLLETLIGWFMFFQKTYNYKIIMMSAIISNLEDSITNDNITFQKSEWSPTRKLYGIYHLPKSEKLIYSKKNILAGQIIQEPYSLVLKYKRNRANINSILYKESHGKKKVKGFDANASDTKYDLCWKAIKTLNERPILVYFFQKKDINSFADRSKKYLEKITNEQSLSDLKRTVIKKLGANHKLCKALDYGVAFHNGDLPEDVRTAIENAYRKGVIKILACTTTLADGVNLPVSTLIIGSCFNYNFTRGINNSDYKNIIGRIGRALTDTEGKIFIIKHDEYYDDFVKKRILSFAKPSLLETPLRSAIEDVVTDIDDTIDLVESVVEGKRVSEEMHVHNMINRLQVFVFSLYEQLEANDFELFYQEYVNCFFINTSETTKRIIKPITQAMYTVATDISGDFLHKCNCTGLSYSTNIKMNGIVQKMSQEFNVNIFSSSEIISKEIYSEILTCQEFTPPSEDIDNYGVLKQWLNGGAYIEIRDNYFSEINGSIEERTQFCTQYIREMFQYKLPWAFSALLVFCENTFLKTVISVMPQYIKYGTKDGNAIELCIGGIASRELAITLSKCYSEDTEKSNDDDITKWLVKISPDKLAKLLDQQFDYYTLNQVSKFRSVRREMSHEFEKNGYLSCNVAGIYFYDYREAYGNNVINPESFVLLEQDRDNAYDMYAVCVFSVDHRFKLGHIPALYSEEIFDLIESGDELYGIVQSCNPRILSIRVLKTPDR